MLADICFGIRNIVIIDLCQKIVFNHLLNHVIGGADNIIFGCAGLNFGKHDFIGFEFIINYLDSRLLLKHGDGIGIYVFSPVVNNDFPVGAGRRSRAAGRKGKDSQGQGEQQGNGFFHFGFLLKSKNVGSQSTCFQSAMPLFPVWKALCSPTEAIAAQPQK